VRPLRIAVDATSLYSARAGIGRFTSSLLEELAHRADVDVVAFAVTWRGQEDLQSLVPPGVAVASGKMAAAPLRALWLRVDHPRIERWTGPVDIVHGPNFVVPPAAVPRVASVHDVTFLHFPEFCTDDVLQYPGLIRRAIRTGAWIHTDSSFVRDEVIEAYGVDPDRVVAVPLGVTAPASLDAARGRVLAGADTYVLALGTIEPRKNLPMLVDAFDSLAADDADLRLVVAGPDGWGVEAYDAAVRRAHHSDRIVRLGFVPEADRGDLVAGASVVAVPSHYEGFGLTAAEAMLAGTPVVASNAGSHPEVIGDGGLLVSPDDREELATALHRVLTDTSFASELRERGLRQARGYTWSATAQAMVDLWRQVVGAS
jgi:glycosyltransferase involved in cell wall biosynthesis